MKDPRHSLVPAPACFEAREGRLDLSRGLVIHASAPLAVQAGLLAGWLSGILPGLVAIQADGAEVGGSRPGDIARSCDLPGRPARLELALDASLAGREAYRLEVSADLVTIVASTTDGLVRGASTFRQLALTAKALGGHSSVPACRIEDAPRFPWRGFMLDTARNYFPVDFVERLIDLSSLHKLNIFHWHLSDDQAWRLDLPGLPELARAGSRRRDIRHSYEVWKEGAYSADDVRRVIAFAADRGITVVPEIESPGHALSLLASHPELSCAAAIAEAEGKATPSFLPVDSYGVFEDILCAGNEGVFDLLEEVVEGLAGLFPGPWVHMGGDEAPKARWLSCPRCRARMEDLCLKDASGSYDPEGLQAWFMSRVAAILARHGKRLVGWDEILDAEVETLSDGSRDGAGVRARKSAATLPKDAIVASWRGYSGGLHGARLGHDVVMCPQTKACYLDHKHLDSPLEPGQLGTCTVRDSYAFEPVPPGLSPEEEGHILGGQANAWSELMYFGKQVEYMVFPRLCAISEALWSPRGTRDFPDFERRLPAHLARLDALGVNYYRGPLF